MTTTAQDKTIEEVKIRLLRNKMTITDLAGKLRPKRHRNTVSQAIHHPLRFPKLHREVMTYMGKLK